MASDQVESNKRMAKVVKTIKLRQKLNSRLKLWRSAKGISQRQAAEILGISKRTLQEWEQGRRAPRGLALETLSKPILADERPQPDR
jgi:DNA-binding transcriptional regulator YiaG